MYASSAQTPPPNDGNWQIKDTTTINDRSIVLNGDIIIEEDGKLNLYNVNLQFNCEDDRQYRIKVKEGGEFNIYDSEISSSTEYYYEIEVESDAEFNIYNSNLTEYYTYDVFSIDDENLMEAFTIIFIDVLIVAVVVIVLVVFFYRYSHKARKVMATTMDSLVGKNGMVVETVKPNTFSGQVKVDSRIWSASADRLIDKDIKVRVVATKGINVIVEKAK